ncbi:MAG: PEP-CTERM sorting domain-containing protein [Phycisphaerales bacterium]|nr:PEP-CTERM sorting domain-containing protein [Phycisphaerales bacterium]
MDKVSKSKALLAAGLLAGFVAAPASAAVLFSDDMSSGAAWTVNALSADDTATFGYDYGTLAGIPAAPTAGSDTIGLRLASNTVDGTEGGVTVTATGQSFSGIYTLSYDVWVQWDAATGGSTENVGGGVGYDGTTIQGDLGTGSGGHLLMVGDGSSSRDYRMYKDAGEQFIASGQYNPAILTNTNDDPLLQAISPSVDISTFDPPQTGATGFSGDGVPGFNWTHVDMIVNEGAGTIRIELDGLWLGTLDTNIGSPVPLSGAISLFHYDRYGSVAGQWAAAYFDNIVVTDLPEPASLGLLAIGGIALLRRRVR